MSGIGAVVRCDSGGLGNLTWEFWRHMRPERTLVVMANGPACGSPCPERYQGGEVRLARTRPTLADAEWLCRWIDTIYTAETWYGPIVPQVARRREVRTVLHVMPEYWLPDVHADLLLAPTTWEAPPGSTFLPVPVATDRLPVRRIDRVDTLYHVASPDHHDRNGTQLLLAALLHVGRRCELLIRQAFTPHHVASSRTEKIGRVTVRWLPHQDGPYWEAWPEEAQALVLPRRYAGLSLPIQEAAALGLPIITLDRSPESEWIPNRGRVAARITGRVRTWRSREVDAWSAEPTALAGRISTLVADASLAKALAGQSRKWGESMAWEHHTGAYQRVLRGAEVAA